MYSSHWEDLRVYKELTVMLQTAECNRYRRQPAEQRLLTGVAGAFTTAFLINTAALYSVISRQGFDELLI